MSCRSNDNENSNNNGGDSNQPPRRNNDNNNARRPQHLPPAPRLRHSIPVDEYPSVIHAALAIVNGTARTRAGERDGEEEEAENARNNQGSPPDPRPRTGERDGGEEEAENAGNNRGSPPG